MEHRYRRGSVLDVRDQSGLVGGDDALGAVAQPELVEDAADVSLDRFFGYYKLGRDLTIRQTFGHELPDLDFPRGELLERGHRCGFASLASTVSKPSRLAAEGLQMTTRSSLRRRQLDRRGADPPCAASMTAES